MKHSKYTSKDRKNDCFLQCKLMCVCVYIYRVSQEECVRLREGVPYVKVYRYNPKTPMSKVEWLRR